MGKCTPIVVDEVKYPSIQQAAKKYGLSPDLVRQRLHGDWTIEQAFEIDPPPANTRETFFVPTEFTIAEKKYFSMKEVTEKFGVKQTTFQRRLSNGWTPEQAVGIDPPPIIEDKPITVKGEWYPSIAAASKAYDMDPQIVQWRIRHSWSVEDAILTPRLYSTTPSPLTVDGVTYPSVSAVARAYGVSETAIRTRLKKGQTIAQIVADRSPIVHKIENVPQNRSCHEIVIEGQIFRSYAAAAKYYNISPKIFRQRITRNWTPEQAAELVPPPDLNYSRNGKGVIEPIELNGKIYHSLYAISKDYPNVSYTVLQYRIKNGWTPEQAVELEPAPVRRSKDYSDMK